MEHKIDEIIKEYSGKLKDEFNRYKLTIESMSRNLKDLSYHHEKVSLKELRTRKKMKLEDVAHQLKVSSQSISNYENGYREVPVRLLTKYAQVLEVSVEQLVYSIIQY